MASLAERALLQFEVEQFLYAEAALLDARRYRDWLSLLADDIHYWMPIRRTVMNADLDLEWTAPGEVAFFDDDKALLEMRVRKLEAGSAWSEDPPSRSRHFVSNVRVLAVEGDDLTVEAAFHLYRSRLDTEESHWFGRREDGLRRTGGGLPSDSPPPLPRPDGDPGHQHEHAVLRGRRPVFRIEIDDATGRVGRHDKPSSWGHKRPAAG